MLESIHRKFNITTITTLLLQLCALTFSPPVFAHHHSIAKWRGLSQRFVAGENDRGDVQAIFDLTLENPHTLSYAKRTLIGSIGVGSFQLGDLLRLLQRELQKWPSAKLPENLQKAVGLSTHQQLHELLANWQKRHGEFILSGSLPQHWWQQVKWKKAAFAHTEPQSFLLSDIDIPAMGNNATQLSQLLADFSQKVGAPLQADFLAQFEYRRNAQGTFDLYFISAPTHHKQVYPVIIADVDHPQVSFQQPLARMACEKLLDGLLQLIPNKMVSALLRYPINRWFRLHDQRMTAHRMGALEGLNTRSMGSWPELTPFAQIRPKEVEQAALHILRSESDLWQLLFAPPTFSSWQKSIAQDLQRSERTQQGDDPTQVLGPLFAIIQKNDQRFLSAMAHPSGAQVLIDYQNPQRELDRRNQVEILAMVLHFVDLPIPFLGTVLEKLYHHLVMGPLAQMKVWEARLVANLQVRPENWQREIEYLYSLRQNPFELDLQEEGAMVLFYRQHFPIE